MKCTEQCNERSPDQISGEGLDSDVVIVVLVPMAYILPANLVCVPLLLLGYRHAFFLCLVYICKEEALQHTQSNTVCKKLLCVMHFVTFQGFSLPFLLLGCCYIEKFGTV